MPDQPDQNGDQKPAALPTAIVATKSTAKTGVNGPKKSRARAETDRLVTKAADLLDLITAADKSAAVETLRKNLKATRRVFMGKGHGFVQEPDARVRHEAAMAILAYAYGKPIERQIVASGSFLELSDIVARISASPMAMKKLGHLVPSADPNPTGHNSE